MLPIRLYRTLLWCYPAPFRREYGAEMVGAFAEQVREARQHGGWAAEAATWLHTLFDILLTAPREHYHVIQQDLRYAIRTLASQPGFAAVAVLSLALGIGANTAIFSLINSVLLSPLPVRDPQSLVILTNPASNGITVGSKSGEREEMTWSEFRQLRDSSNVFSSLMACQIEPEPVPVRVGGSEAEETLVQMVSPEYFSTLGVPAVLGRPLSADNDPSAPHAVISYEYWQRRFGGRSDVLGTTITIRQAMVSIIGVTPPSFFGETVGQRPDIWVPLTLQPVVLPGREWLDENPGGDKVMWLHVFGRLKPGVRIETAQAAANVTFQQGLAVFYSSAERASKQWLKVRPAANGASQIRGQIAEPLTMLLAASGLVLLIACANLGNLLLARTTTRTREISVRLAMGASRGRLIRQMLTESMVIAFLGGLAGLAAAWILRAGLLALVPERIHVPVTPDVRVLGFAFVLTLAAGLILSLLPVLRTINLNTTSGLKEQGRGLTASAAWLRAGRFVVIGQVALSLPLLIGAGLLLRTFQNLQHADLGYAKERVIQVRADVQMGGYDEQRRVPLFQRLLESVRAAPGVSAASYSKSGLFLGSRSSGHVKVEGYSQSGDGGGVWSVWDHVGPDYFSTLRIPLLLGREITERDQSSSNRVCVINEAFAKQYFADRNPLGMHVEKYEVVGVARNSRTRNVREDIEPRFYVPAAQPTDVPPRFITFVARTAAEPSSVLADVRRAILSEDANLPITAAGALTELVDKQMAQDRLLARLSMAFGVVALLLAAIGLYGVLSYGVARRTNEIGIRKALGAQHTAVMVMILRETGLLLLAGLVAGTFLAAAGTRFIATRLYGLAPTDPVAIGVAVATLAGVALLAAWVPAHRASRVDPLVALRYE